MNTYCVPSMLLDTRDLDEHIHKTEKHSASEELDFPEETHLKLFHGPGGHSGSAQLQGTCPEGDAASALREDWIQGLPIS